MVYHIGMGRHRNRRTPAQRNNKKLLQTTNNKKSRNKWKSRNHQIHKRV